MKRNEVWVVTGAGGDIGAVLVRQLLAAGKKVAALTGYPKRVLSENPGAKELLTIETYVAGEQSVLNAHTQIIERFGHVDVVVNAADYCVGGAIEEITDQEAREIFDVNYFGVANVCRTFVPDLREQGGGYIFNFLGIESAVTTEYNALYHATKFAADSLTESLSRETAQFGISVTSIKCGPVRTNCLKLKERPAHSLEVYAQIRERASMADAEIIGKETADPEKVAAFVIGLSERDTLPTSIYLTKKASEQICDVWKSLESTVKEWGGAGLCANVPVEERCHRELI